MFLSPRSDHCLSQHIPGGGGGEINVRKGTTAKSGEARSKRGREVSENWILYL